MRTWVHRECIRMYAWMFIYTYIRSIHDYTISHGTIHHSKHTLQTIQYMLNTLYYIHRNNTYIHMHKMGIHVKISISHLLLAHMTALDTSCTRRMSATSLIGSAAMRCVAFQAARTFCARTSTLSSTYILCAYEHYSQARTFCARTSTLSSTYILCAYEHAPRTESCSSSWVPSAPWIVHMHMYVCMYVCMHVYIYMNIVCMYVSCAVTI